jgi:hypothetical protein
MDDDTLHQPGYFHGIVAIINDLNPAAADFDFQLANLRATIQITEFLSLAE